MELLKLNYKPPTRNDTLQSKSRRLMGMARHIIPLKAVCILPILLTALLLALFLTPLTVFATDLPDATPSAEFFVYRNVLETGDELLIIYQNIPYAVLPDTAVYDNYMWRVLAADNVTELGAATSNAFQYNGFRYNVTSVYWDSSNVTAKGMVWGASYPVRLSGMPTAFTTPPEYTYFLNASDYSALTVAAEVAIELGDKILELAADIDFRWDLGIAYSLLNQTETGTVLSIYGETFFRSAIYGIQGMCPQIFAYVINDLELTPRTWSTTYVTTLENQYTGTWVDTAKAAWGALFGTGYDLSSLILTLLLCAGVGMAGFMLSGDPWQGMGLASVVLIGMTRLGFFGLGELALLVALAVVYGVVRLWGVLR